MKFLFIFLFAGFFACASALAADPSKESAEQQQIAAMAKEVQAQQATIIANQAKIDEKLAAVAEAMRQAKIYAGRGR
jgi:hypothetical protein